MNKRRKLLFFAFPAVCCTLGIWQVQRLQWKTSLLADLQRSYTAKGTEIPLYNGNTLPIPFHRYKLSGSFLQQPQIALIGPRFLDRKHGYKLIVPFALENRQVHLVDIGWIEESQSIDQILSTLPQAESSCTLDVIHIKEEHLGILERLIQWTAGGKRTSFPKYLTSAIAQRMGISAGNCYMFQALPNAKANATIRSTVDINSIPNNHLEYAITW